MEEIENNGCIGNPITNILMDVPGNPVADMLVDGHTEPDEAPKTEGARDGQ
jgi:hypothetical protein